MRDRSVILSINKGLSPKFSFALFKFSTVTLYFLNSVITPATLSTNPFFLAAPLNTLNSSCSFALCCE